MAFTFMPLQPSSLTQALWPFRTTVCKSWVDYQNLKTWYVRSLMPMDRAYNVTCAKVLHDKVLDACMRPNNGCHLLAMCHIWCCMAWLPVWLLFDNLLLVDYLLTVWFLTHTLGKLAQKTILSPSHSSTYVLESAHCRPPCHFISQPGPGG